ncbi:MAG: hypothetical protein AB7W37_05670 [Syntrophobacteraceae bacterium]
MPIVPTSAPKTEESNIHREPIANAQWEAILTSLDQQLQALPATHLTEARRLALRIRENLAWLDGHMTEHCRATCPGCEDPCCTGLKVFFNRTDLLYILASGEETPPGQTREHATGACRYLTPSGCTLPRTRRPYVCVWFLCDPQMELLQREPPAFQRRFIGALQDIRICRLQLETLHEANTGPSA